MIVSRKHKRLPIKTRIVRRADEIPQDAWRRVYPPIIENQGFFKAIDDSRLDQFSFYYILAYRRNHLVGIAPCFVMDYPLDTSIKGPLRRVSNAIKRISPNIFSLRAFVCGCPIASGKIAMTEDQEHVFQAIVRRIDHTAKKMRASVIGYKDFEHASTPLLDTLQKSGYSKFDSLPNTELSVRFSDFEEYLNTLSAASRYDLRRKFRRVEGHANIRMEVTSSPDEKTLKEIHDLYIQTEGAHEMGFEVLTPEFFRNIACRMPDSAKFFLWKMEDRLVAFVLCLVSHDRLNDYYVGLDYSIAHKYHLYFLKFRDVLNWCIENKIKVYEMGLTGYEPKRRLGFDLVPLYLYVRHRNRLIRPLFGMICQFLKFENFDPALKKALQKQNVYGNK